MWCEISRYQQFNRGATESIFREIVGVSGEVLIILLLLVAVVSFVVQVIRKQGMLLAHLPLAAAAVLLAVRLASQAWLFCARESVHEQLAHSLDIVGAMISGALLIGLPVAFGGYLLGVGVQSAISKFSLAIKEAASYYEATLILTVLVGSGLLPILPVASIVAFLCAGVMLGLLASQRIALNTFYTFTFGLGSAFILSAIF